MVERLAMIRTSAITPAGVAASHLTPCCASGCLPATGFPPVNAVRNVRAGRVVLDMAQASLLERATDLETLRTAWRRVRAKGSTGGRDGMTVGDFANDSEQHLQALRAELVEQRYVPEPLQQIAIPKGAGKTGFRPLRLPAVRDKIAQEAVRSVVEPRLDRSFLDCSYGYRPGRGAERAIRRVTHYLIHGKRRWSASHSARQESEPSIAIATHGRWSP